MPQSISSIVIDTVIFDFFCLQTGGRLCHYAAALELNKASEKVHPLVDSETDLPQ